MSSETNVAEKQMHKTGVKMVVQVGMLAALALILMFLILIYLFLNEDNQSFLCYTIRMNIKDQNMELRH